MELGFHANGTFLRTQFPIKPALRPQFPKSLYSCWKLKRNLPTPCRATSSSDSPRRRPRKSAIPKTKPTPPKGFAPVPKPPKKDQNDIEEKVDGEETEPEDGLQPRIPRNTSATGKRLEGVNDEDRRNTEEKVVGEKIEPELDLQPSISGNAVETENILEEIKEPARRDVEERVVSQETEPSDLHPSLSVSAEKTRQEETENQEQSNIEGKVVGKDEQEENLQPSISSSSTESRNIQDEIKETNDKTDKMPEQNEALVIPLAASSSDDIDAKPVEYEIEENTQAHTDEFDHGTSHLASLSEIKAGVKEKKEVKEGDQPDPLSKRKLIEDLAEQSLARGYKIFVFPELVKADETIEVFLNRSLSTLTNENEIIMKGAFNGWRWKPFTENMQKSELKGDWWTCHLYVPKEAYRIDFVFFNGGNIYENNNSDDFFIRVQGELDIYSFEDFLLEEQRKEIERIALEQAEKERQAEEERRREEERAASEADRAYAKLEVQKKREAVNPVMRLATKAVDNLWYIEPSIFKGENRVRFYYNRINRPLEHATEVWIHGGYNNWSEGLSIVEKLQQSGPVKSGGDWWYAEVSVPDRALILDWVFADGPPRNAEVYDNNNLLDFHTLIPNIMSEELFWVEEEERIYRKLQDERKQKEEAARLKAEKTARMKAEVKEKSIIRFLLSQKHIVYTDPVEVHAGKMVTVLYNPSNTVLNGKPEVWFRCSFNRWTHRDGPLPPQKMELAENGTHMKTTVKVPIDAYMMDFVFSENEEGGIFDNKHGMDYHIPVLGGTAKEPPMHIVHIAVEMAPIAKVGGLGDVVTSLSRAVQELGHKVDIIFPKYDCLDLSNVKDFHFRQSFFWSGTEIKVWFGKVEGLAVYFIEPQNGMFWVGCVYGTRNDGDRFGFFCHAALEFLLQSGIQPDILHCHDWSSAPVTWLLKENYVHYGMSNARAVFTIHNLEFGVGHIAKAMTYADKATTVSHTYSEEVSGNPAISPHLYKFHGILNGIDPDIWDPYNDNFIPVAYTSENVVEGKTAAKEALQQRLGLKTSSDHPLVGIITRLTVQKGIHLIKHAIWRTLERNGQVVLLGSAPDPRIQNDFVHLANQLHSSHGDRARLVLTYDEPLSHLIYAGSDFILVPSIFEPCGLTQLVAMRYGAIPVVRKTGGLYDTVFDVDDDKERAQALDLEPNGFSFDVADAHGVDYALNRAISAWYDGREWFNSLCKRVMEQDWSWNRPALDYMELYHSARK